jgi:predicted HTH domain antitoxin
MTGRAACGGATLLSPRLANPIFFQTLNAHHPPITGWKSAAFPAILPGMTITLPDDPALQGLDEAQLRLDLACGLFAAGRVSRTVAARVAGLDSMAFDEELFRRKIPSFTEEMLDQDLASLDRLHQQ